MPAVVAFGPFELDPRTNELRKRGLRIKLRPQSAQVLAALLERPGELVTRDELKTRLWPGVEYTDFENGLNSAVNRLRIALGDSAEQPLYIETLARMGYRFIAPVADPVVEEPAPPAAAPAPSIPPVHAALPALPAQRPRGWMYAVVAIVAVILISGLWPQPQPKTRVTPLTSDAHDKWMSVLVAGGRVFYAASKLSPQGLHYDLSSVSVTGGEPRSEPSPCPRPSIPYVEGPGAADYAHQRFVFACVTDAGEGDLWQVGFDGSHPQWIGHYDPINPIVPISPDFETLVFTRKNGLFTRAVGGGQEQLLARVDGIEMRSNAWRFYEVAAPGPFFHPTDGRIGFQRVVAGVSRLWEIRRDGSGLRPMLPGFTPEQRLARWSPDGRRLYFVSDGDLYLQGGGGWLGWMRRRTPVRLTSGPVQFGPPQEDPANPLVLYAQGRTPQAVLMKLDRRTSVWEPFLGGLSADCINVSPDGQWIAYVSWPGGELWQCRRNGTGKVLLEAGLSTFHPRWSPDGSRIAFAARPRGPSTEWEPWRIYTIQAGGGKRQPVPGVAGPAHDPTWSPDGRRLAFAPMCGVVPPSERHISIVNLETGAVEPVPGSDSLFSTRWSPDGRSLLALPCDKPGMMVYNFAAGKWSVLAEYTVFNPEWSRDGRSVYGMTNRSGNMLIRIDVATRKTEEIRKVAEFDITGVEWPIAFWTPEEEPVVLKDLTSTQIYRIERDR